MKDYKRHKKENVTGTHCKDARLAALRDITKANKKNYVVREYKVLEYLNNYNPDVVPI